MNSDDEKIEVTDRSDSAPIGSKTDSAIHRDDSQSLLKKLFRKINELLPFTSDSRK